MMDKWMDKCCGTCKYHYYDKEDKDVNRLNKYHEEWKRMKVSIESGKGTSNNR